MRTNFVRTSLRTFVRTLPSWFALYREPQCEPCSLCRSVRTPIRTKLVRTSVRTFTLAVFTGAGGATGAGTL